jgi:hypothetical protein
MYCLRRHRFSSFSVIYPNLLEKNETEIASAMDEGGCKAANAVGNTLSGLVKPC